MFPVTSGQCNIGTSMLERTYPQQYFMAGTGTTGGCLGRDHEHAVLYGEHAWSLFFHPHGHKVRLML